jgi:hypothetical protein
VLARVAHGDHWIAVSALDLSGSPQGSWSEPSAAGSCHSVTVKVLVSDPGQWTVAAAVRGREGDRFSPIEHRVADHREGRALEVQLPMDGGWSVLRLRCRNSGRNDASSPLVASASLGPMVGEW